MLIGDLIGNKIANKITSVDKWKGKNKKSRRFYIPPEKRHQIIDDLKLFWAWNVISVYKNGTSKNCKLAWHDF